ncbi:hypothetical protein [Microbispora sp. NBRC 16548]|uniref:hypothetical protein n=1 Tax=Microbispora sp. NBRC 16548 TaxID=3030994 RepID=UPI0024A36333|nr:hypothetical protein [Microbispora sp. NBRC 16548]GLX06185.1 hypothetical protein Misp03_31120 [Microbispora sp. NBRC 16548]
MCGYPVLAAASLSLLLMPLPRCAFLESPALATAFFHAPALASAFLESPALASTFFHAPALASAFTAAFLEPSAFTTAFFHAPALASAFTAAFLEPSALASAFFHAPALASAFTATFLESAPFAATFATVVTVRPLALTATAPASGAGLCRVLHDLRGAAGRIDRLRLHRHRDDEGRRRDRASSQCFLEHEYHSVDSVTVAGEHPDARSANRSIEPWIQTLILTLEVTKGPVTQQCANNRFSQQKTNVIGGVVGPFLRADNSFTRVAGFLPHH